MVGGIFVAGCVMDDLLVSLATSVAGGLLTLLFPPLSLPLSVEGTAGFEGSSSMIVSAMVAGLVEPVFFD